MSHRLTTGNVFSFIEQWAPKSLAYDWDPIGLQVGSYQEPVKKVMITLDVDMRVVEEAIEKGVNVIIAHHPLLFNPLQSIDVDSPKGKTIEALIRHKITVYAAHTNLDIAEGGVNDMIAEKLGLQDTNVLIHTESKKLYKIAVFVPNEYSSEVEKAIGDAGGGHIGNYRDCNFKVQGEGTFRPIEHSDPFIGEKNKLTRVQETRIETIVEEEQMHKVIDAIKRVHPYEEVAYDMYPVENKGKGYGLGRIGTWEAPLEVSAAIEKVKDALDLSQIRFVGNDKKAIQKVAVVGGSGEKFISAAKQKGADVYITGDITYHAAQDAEQMDLAVIDAGHYIEYVMKEATAQYVRKQLEKHQIECIVSMVHTDPFSYR